MTDAETAENNDRTDLDYSTRRIDLSLSLEFGPEMFLDANGEVNEDIMLHEALDYATEASRGEFDTEISLVDDGVQSAADTDQLIERLANGDRDILSDADAINTSDGLQAVEAIHEAANNERVILHYNFYTAYQTTGEGSMDEVDIFTNDQ